MGRLFNVLALSGVFAFGDFLPGVFCEEAVPLEASGGVKREGGLEERIRVAQDRVKADFGFENLLELARLYDEGGRCEEGLGVSRHAVIFGDKNPVVYALNGSFLNDLKLFGRAEKAFRKGIRLNAGLGVGKKCWEVHHQYGEFFCSLGNYDGALRQFDLSLSIKQDNVVSVRWKGLALRKLGRVGEATELLRRAVELEPSGKSYSSLAAALAESGDLGGAVSAAQKGVEAEPSSAGFCLDLGRVLALHGKEDEAVEAAQRVLVLEPNNPLVLVDYANFLYGLRKVEEAEVFLEKAVVVNEGLPANKRGVSVFQQFGAFLALERRYSDALLQLDKALAVRPDSVGVLGWKLWVLKKMGGRTDEVVGLAEKLVSLDECEVFYRVLGDAYVDAGLLDKAEASFLKAVELRPTGVDAYFGLGRVYSRLGCVEKADGAFKQAKGHSIMPPILVGISGNAFCDVERFVEAEASLDEKIMVAEGKVERNGGADALLGLAGLYYDARRWDDGLRVARKVLELEELPCAWNLVGEALEKLGRRNEAKDAYAKGIALNEQLPVNKRVPDVLANLGGLLYNEGRVGEAEKLFEKALEVDPKHLLSLRWQLYVLRKQDKDYQSVLGEVVRLTLKEPTPKDLVQLSYIYEREKRWDDALCALDKALSIKPTFVSAITQLGDVLHGMGKCEEAKKAYLEGVRTNEVLPDSEKDEEVHNDFGSMLMKEKDYDGALEQFEKALLINSRSASALGGKAYALREKKERLDEAMKCWGKIVELSPVPANFAGLAYHCLQVGELGKAEKAARDGIELNPNFELNYRRLCEVFEKRNKFDEAEGILKEGISACPDSAVAVSNLAWFYLRRERGQESIDAFVKAVELRPNDADNVSNLGYALWKQGKNEEALPHVEKALFLDASRADDWNRLGMVLENLKQLGKAEGAYRKAVGLDDKCFAFHLNLAIFYYKKNQHTKAVQYFEKAYAIDSEQLAQHSWFGSSLCELGRFSDAEPYLRKFVEYSPKNAFAYQCLAWCLRQQNKDDEAEDFCKKGLEYDKNHEGLLNVLGSVYSNNGHPDEAIEIYNGLLKRFPNNSTFYNNLGVAYSAAKDHDKAIECFKKSLELDPSGATTHCNFGKSLRDIGKTTEAIEQLEKVIELEKNLEYKKNTPQAQQLLGRLR